MTSRNVPRTGFIGHIGLGVPDIDAAKEYYDELMPILGFEPAFTNAYSPAGQPGTPLFFYPALEPGPYSRHGTGLQHIAFVVPERAIVREAHEWARARGAEILHEPREFPEYVHRPGAYAHYATFWLDPHGFMLEAVCHRLEE